jgi:hypothetical protein
MPAGVWRDGSGEQRLGLGLTQDELVAQEAALRDQNLLLVAIHSYAEDGSRRWAGVWRDGAGEQRLGLGLTQDELVAQEAALRDQNLLLVAIHSYTDGGQQLWAGVWRDGAGEQRLGLGLTQDELVAQEAALRNQNLLLVAISCYVEDGSRRWAGVWRDGSGEQRLGLGLTQDELIAQEAALRDQNLLLVAIHSYTDGGQQLWAGVWRDGAGEQRLGLGLTQDEFVAQEAALRNQNLLLVAFDMQAEAVPAPFILVLHIRVLNQPSLDLQTMRQNMQALYRSRAEIDVQVRSSLPLKRPDLIDLPVGACVMGDLTQKQEELFALREGVGAGEVVAYFVRTTNPPLNGCAAHPPGRPGAVIAQGASLWTLAHEIGHVLGLPHIPPAEEDGHRLMTGRGTGTVTPPVTLSDSEVTTMQRNITRI